MNLYASPAALEGIQEIKRYISEDLPNPDSAQKIAVNIVEGIKKICDFPEAGSLLSSKIGVNTNYRFISSGNYLAFYRVKESTVFVDRVLYAKRDYTKILFINNDSSH